MCIALASDTLRNIYSQSIVPHFTPWDYEIVPINGATLLIYMHLGSNAHELC